MQITKSCRIIKLNLEFLSKISTVLQIEEIFAKVSCLNRHYSKIIRQNNKFWICYNKYLKEYIDEIREKD